MGNKINPVNLRMKSLGSWSLGSFDKKTFSLDMHKHILVKHFISRYFKLRNVFSSNFYMSINKQLSSCNIGLNLFFVSKNNWFREVSYFKKSNLVFDSDITSKYWLSKTYSSNSFKKSIKTKKEVGLVSKLVLKNVHISRKLSFNSNYFKEVLDHCNTFFWLNSLKKTFSINLKKVSLPLAGYTTNSFLFVSNILTHVFKRKRVKYSQNNFNYAVYNSFILNSHLKFLNLYSFKDSFITLVNKVSFFKSSFYLNSVFLSELLALNTNVNNVSFLDKYTSYFDDDINISSYFFKSFSHNRNLLVFFKSFKKNVRNSISGSRDYFIPYFDGSYLFNKRSHLYRHSSSSMNDTLSNLDSYHSFKRSSGVLSSKARAFKMNDIKEESMLLSDSTVSYNFLKNRSSYLLDELAFMKDLYYKEVDRLSIYNFFNINNKYSVNFSSHVLSALTFLLKRLAVLEDAFFVESSTLKSISSISSEGYSFLSSFSSSSIMKKEFLLNKGKSKLQAVVSLNKKNTVYNRKAVKRYKRYNKRSYFYNKNNFLGKWSLKSQLLEKERSFINSYFYSKAAKNRKDTFYYRVNMHFSEKKNGFFLSKRNININKTSLSGKISNKEKNRVILKVQGLFEKYFSILKREFSLSLTNNSFSSFLKSNLDLPKISFKSFKKGRLRSFLVKEKVISSNKKQLNTFNNLVVNKSIFESIDKSFFYRYNLFSLQTSSSNTQDDFLSKKYLSYLFLKKNLVYINKIIKSITAVKQINWTFYISYQKQLMSTENIGSLVRYNLSINYQKFRNRYSFLWNNIEDSVKNIELYKLTLNTISQLSLQNSVSIKSYLSSTFFFSKHTDNFFDLESSFRFYKIKKYHSFYSNTFSRARVSYFKKYLSISNTFFFNSNKISSLVVKNLNINKMIYFFNNKNKQFIFMNKQKDWHIKRFLTSTKYFNNIINNFSKYSVFLHNIAFNAKFSSNINTYLDKNYNNDLIYKSFKESIRIILGYKILGSGRLGRVAKSGRADSTVFKKGRTPLNTLNINVDFSMVNQITRNGVYGVKIFKFYKNISSDNYFSN